MARTRKAKKTLAAQTAAASTRNYSRKAVMITVAALFIGVGFAAYAGNAVLHGHVSITEHRIPSKAGISTPSCSAKSTDSGARNQSAGSSDLAGQYGPAANSPAVAAAIRNAQISVATDAASVGAKAAADKYEALEHGHPLAGTDPMQLIMHGYVPPGMPSQQATMLYNSLPNNLKSPHVPEPGTPEWIAIMSHEPIDPETSVPFSLKEQQVQAANQKIAEECVRKRCGPIYIPALHRDYNRVAKASSNIATLREKANQSYTIDAQYSYDPYGNQTRISGTGPDADFGYAGYYMHRRSGLNLARFRVYNPALGRWMSRDPIQDPSFRLMPHSPEPPDPTTPSLMASASTGSSAMAPLNSLAGDPVVQAQLGNLIPRGIKRPRESNAYTYVKNNPINFRDPSGLLAGMPAPPPSKVPPLDDFAGLGPCLDWCAANTDNDCDYQNCWAACWERFGPKK